MRRAAGLERARDGIGDQVGDRDVRIDDAVDERRVGAVLEQAAHQVGEQRLVRAYRGIDAAGVAPVFLAHDLVEQAFAHAVQALEFEVAARRQRVHGGDRERVVAGELRVDRVRGRQHGLGARQVRDVGVDLAREDRIPGEPVDLRALDLGIPIGALDQAHHEAALAAAAQVDQPVDDRAGALLVALHDEAQAVPAGERGIAGEQLEYVERQVETVRFLRVDVEADVVAPRKQREPRDGRHEFVQCARALRPRIARVQRRQLDRDARSLVDARAPAGLADRVYRGFVRGEIVARIVHRHRRLAQHVERVAIAARDARARVVQRLADGSAGHELLAQEPHGQVHALADQRFAALAQQRGQRLFHRRIAARVDELAGDQQTPRGGIDEQRRAAADVRAPVALRDLVADQAVARGRVRDAQQRLGQAHERDAFARLERELEHQRVDAAGRRARCANTFGQRRREPLRRRQLRGRESGFCRHGVDCGGLVATIVRGNAFAQIGGGSVRNGEGRRSVAHGRLTLTSAFQGCAGQGETPVGRRIIPACAVAVRPRMPGKSRISRGSTRWTQP